MNNKEKTSINEAQFIASYSKFGQIENKGIPEFAFIGRSNVGKSSLVNYLTGRKNLAKTSATPGKTQLLNYFLIEKKYYFVDLPGYGYAKVSKKKKATFEVLISDYLENSKNLLCLFLLIDSRHDPQPNDMEFMEYLGMKQIPFAIIFTKSDKLSQRDLSRNQKFYKNKLLETWEGLPDMFLTSSSKQKGKEEILLFIQNCLNQ